MNTPTPLQRQIEQTVTKGRGYAQPASTASFRLLISRNFIEFYNTLEQQRLQDTLQSMEAQQSSPTLNDLFTQYLESILRNTPRSGDDIKLIRHNYKKPEFPLKERFPDKRFDEIDPFAKPTDSKLFPFDSDKPLHEFPYLGKPWDKSWKEEISSLNEYPFFRKCLKESFERPETAPPQTDSDLLQFPPPRPNINPSPEHLDSSSLLDIMRRLNQKRDPEKKRIE